MFCFKYKYILNALEFLQFPGGEIVSTFGKPELVKLGKCKLIEEIMIGEDKVYIHNLYILDEEFSARMSFVCSYVQRNVKVI